MAIFEESNGGTRGVSFRAPRMVLHRDAPARLLYRPPERRRTLLGLAPLEVFYAAATLAFAVAVATNGDTGSRALGVGLIVAVALVGAAASIVGRKDRVEWDGHVVVMQSLLVRRRVIGTPGTGTIVRATSTQLPFAGPTEFWIDDDGKVLARIFERQWDPAALERLAAEARIPVVDLGTVRFERLVEQYPGVLPFGANCFLRSQRRAGRL